MANTTRAKPGDGKKSQRRDGAKFPPCAAADNAAAAAARCSGSPPAPPYADAGHVRAIGYAANMSLSSMSSQFASIATEMQQPRLLPDQAYAVLDRELRKHTRAEVIKAAEVVPADQTVIAYGPLFPGQLTLRDWLIARKESIDETSTPTQ